MKSYIYTLILVAGLLVGCQMQPVDNANINKQRAHDASIAAAIGYLQADNYSRAFHHAEAALDYKKNSPQAYQVMGLIYQRQKDAIRAERMFLAAIKEDPSFSQARNNYGQFLIEQQRYGDAIEQLKRSATDINYASRALSYSNIGKSYHALGVDTKAVANWTRALELNKRQPYPAFELSKYFLDKSNYLRANEYYTIFEQYGEQTEETAFVGLEVAIGMGDENSIQKYTLLWEALKRR
ncbi:MAG: tetratricopeptide repeat protein [Pseudomonadota bacterium]|nr:tetratricopeptide repeat protein [Pseudomonadota bacterium]